MTTRRAFFGALAGAAAIPCVAWRYPPVRTIPMYNIEDPRSASAAPADPGVGEVIQFSIPRWSGDNGDERWVREWAAKTYHVSTAAGRQDGLCWRLVPVDHRPTWAEVCEIVAKAKKERDACL